jgi:hypothetical protein
MPICTSGFSRPKAGIPKNIIITSDVMRALLAGSAPWLQPFAYGMPDISIDSTVFCASDPPALPAWTEPILIALGAFSGTGPQMAIAAAQMAQWVTGIAWYQWCECSAAPQPVAPAPPPPPTNVPTFTPPAPTSTTPGYLGTILSDAPLDYWRMADPTYGRVVSIGSQFIDLMPWSMGQGWQGFSGPASDGGAYLSAGGFLVVDNYPIPAVSSLEGWFWPGAFFGAGANFLLIPGATKRPSLILNEYEALTWQVDGGAVGAAVNFSRQRWHHVVIVSTGADTRFYFDGVLKWTNPTIMTAHPGDRLYVGGWATGLWDFFISEVAFYGTALSAARVLAHYNAADNTLFRPQTKPVVLTPPTNQALTNMVNLLQRQLAPFGYIPRGVYPGLVGNGQLAVQGLLGLLVNVTTLPGFLGRELGQIDTLFSVGWLDLGTADGFLSRQRITHTIWLTFPSDMSLVTLVNYTLTPGVVATITELVREP